MTNYEITVNGKSYDVTVQKKKKDSTTFESETKTAIPAVTPVVSVPPKVVQTPNSTAVLPAGGGYQTIMAPMPGKIMVIKVSIGDNVKKGQELIIMEAMKMHNPILSPIDGIITEIGVQVNDPVQSGQKLLSVG